MLPSAALTLLFVLAQTPAPVAAPVETSGIEDNSFLVEEAYNQERGVVQHISNFQRAQGGAWVYTFTQEWPVNRWPKNQFSYTVGALSSGGGAGIGDALINWRYQVMNTARLAIAPRISLLLPFGDAAAGRGEGGSGVQVNLPISVRAADGRVELHSNAGATIVPRAKSAAGDRAHTNGVTLAQSVVWRVRPVLNPFVEFVYGRQEQVVGPGATVWGTSAIVNPGVRWAHNLANGTQIVPGVSVPVDTKAPSGDRWSAFLYLSIEHPFGRAHE
jgi:hypothetical protein